MIKIRIKIRILEKSENQLKLKKLFEKQGGPCASNEGPRRTIESLVHLFGGNMHNGLSEMYHAHKLIA